MNNANADGLRNHMMGEAIQVGIDRSFIAGGLETAAQLTPYKNFVQWSGKATGPVAEMFLINGNHRVALIQTLYEKDIVHCQDAIATICEGQNERQKGDAAKELEKINEKLSQKAVWLVEFFDLNLIRQSPQESVILFHLSANRLRPEKVDTDTEKLKNLLHLLCGKSDVEVNMVYTQIAHSWSDSKEANSVHPAFIISHRELAKFFAQVFAYTSLESSKLLTVSLIYDNLNPHLTGLFLAIFKPMLSVLDIFDEIICSTQELLNMLLPSISPTDVTRPVLDNLIVKLQWIRHGFHPVQEPRVHLDTPYPLFTELSMIVIMGNWNTSKITVCKRDNFGNDINYGPALAEVADWLFPLCCVLYIHQTTAYHNAFLPPPSCPYTSEGWPSLAQPKASIAALNAGLDGCVSEERKSYFHKVHDILRFTPFPWEQLTPNKYSQTFITDMLLEVNHLTEQEKLLQIPTIWDLRQSFGPCAKSQAPWLYWDGMESQPTLSPSNPLLALMPKEYTGESLGTTVEQAASAPHITAQNVNAMQKIVELISVPTLGLCDGETTAKLDPDLKMPLENFLMSLAAVTVKKTTRLQEPTADLTHTAPFPMVQELLGTAGFGSNFQSLQYLNPLKAQEFWRGRTTAELDPYAVQSLHSTSTIAYSERARLEQQHALDKMARHVRKFAKKKPSRILPQPDDGSDSEGPSTSTAQRQQLLAPPSASHHALNLHDESSAHSGPSGSDKRLTHDDGFDTDTCHKKQARTSGAPGGGYDLLVNVTAADKLQQITHTPEQWATVIKALSATSKSNVPVDMKESTLVALLFTIHHSIRANPTDLAILLDWAKALQHFPTDHDIYMWIKGTWANHPVVWKVVEGPLKQWADDVMSNLHSMDED
ncbi:hypothetical protein BKA82DRAFT_4019883 [Pisolithus tinctorius]|nr:hypothetical protein BKA82DRAFT_4019883 [Pisolithus tinctorius]